MSFPKRHKDTHKLLGAPPLSLGPSVPHIVSRRSQACGKIVSLIRFLALPTSLANKEHLEMLVVKWSLRTLDSIGSDSFICKWTP